MTSGLTILVIGHSGRDNALAWKLSESPRVKRILVLPGNGGCVSLPKTQIVHDIMQDTSSYVQYALEQQVDIVVLGPVVYCLMGIADALMAAGVRVFGPSKAAACIEGSKIFAKQFMQRHNIPTADFLAFHDESGALQYVERHFGSSNEPLVIKCDTITALRDVPVVIAHSPAQAHDAVCAIFAWATLSAQPMAVSIEKFLRGQELSFIVASDGKSFIALPPCRDHKRLNDGDKGPNTGGMGSYCPVPWLRQDTYQRIIQQVIGPALQGMHDEGMPFVGFLYAGLMISANGDVHVLEFNCRLGDPETQSMLPRLRSDLVDLLDAGTTGRLHEITLDWDERYCVAVVLSREGRVPLGNLGSDIPPVELPPALTPHYATEPHALVFHMYTSPTVPSHAIYSSALCVVGVGDSLEKARTQAYEHIHSLNLDDSLHWRRDIALRIAAPR